MPQPPGILWVNSKITSPTSLSDSNFNKWYNEIHIPDILATSTMHTAFRYKSINPSAERPYLAVYPVNDVDWLRGWEFNSIPTNSDYFPRPSRECFDFVGFDTRFYEELHGFEVQGAKSGPTNLIISAGLTPAVGTDTDFDAWHKEEHYLTLAECPGYVRMRRFKLKTALRPEPNPTTYLALHEFDCETLPESELAKSRSTPWAKKVMGGLVGQEVGVYKLIGAWGDVKAGF